MSSSAFGHFQLCAPHKINYSFLASGHSKLDAACQEQMIRWTDGDHHTEAVSLNLTCPGWCWRCWSCWPSWLILLPARSSGCSAAADPPVGDTAGFRVAAWLLYSTQAWLLCPTVPSVYCPPLWCEEHTSHHWESSKRYLFQEKTQNKSLNAHWTVTMCIMEYLAVLWWPPEL